mgnify:CR=1 FL=1
MTRASIDIAAELVRLETLSNFELRGEWLLLHHMQPPKSLSRELLLRDRSLSVVAREITGSHWSGPRFFGLTSKKGAEDG